MPVACTVTASLVGATGLVLLGFGAAGVGMTLGLIVYVLGGPILGEAGLRPSRPDTPQAALALRRQLQAGLALDLEDLGLAAAHRQAHDAAVDQAGDDPAPGVHMPGQKFGQPGVVGLVKLPSESFQFLRARRLGEDSLAGKRLQRDQPGFEPAWI